LPSEAEWEYAARTGTTTARYWGDRAEDGCDYEKVADLSLKKRYPDYLLANCNDGQALTEQVDRTSPTRGDFTTYSATSKNGSRIAMSRTIRKRRRTGSAVTIEHCFPRVVRGGSWINGPREIRAAYRYGLAPALRLSYIGFRVARTVSP